MPSRRELLAAAGVASVAGAGCTDLTSPDGTPARLGTLEYPEGDVVARTVREVDHVGEWTLRADALVYERYEPDGLVLFTDHRILSGTDSHEWEHAGIDETHDWTAGERTVALARWNSNAEPTDDDAAQARRRNRSSSDVGRWEIRLTSPSTSLANYQFLTDVRERPSMGTGDLLAENRPTFHFAESGLLGDDDALELALEVVYGEIDG